MKLIMVSLIVDIEVLLNINLFVVIIFVWDVRVCVKIELN